MILGTNRGSTKSQRQKRAKIDSIFACILIFACALFFYFPSSVVAQEVKLSPPRSIEVRVEGAYVYTSASVEGSRRGTLALGARLQPFEVQNAKGCNAPWYRIGDESWICGESVLRRGTAPHAISLPYVEDGQVVPNSYGFAGPDGARWYRNFEDIRYDEWEREFNTRTGLHIKSMVNYGNQFFYRLVTGGYVPRGDVRQANPSQFSGIKLGKNQLAGWVHRRPLPVRPRAGKGRILRRLIHRSGVTIFEKTRIGKVLWVRIGDNEWVRERGLKVLRVKSPPPSIGPQERWIHVDRTMQILTAYEGTTPVYATRISSGRLGAATPAGIFRIWAKLATGSMSGEGETIDVRPYLMQGVPWVMYFNEGVAIHGAYWHNDFGRRRSHGCVNLAPRDAAYIFRFTSPTLPPGWRGILPTQSDRGTLIVVE